LPENKPGDGPRKEIITVLGAGEDPGLSAWVQEALEGSPHRLRSLPCLPGNAELPEGIEPDLAVIFEDEGDGFLARLQAFKQGFPLCQILLVGRADSKLSPREIGPGVVRHWFFRPLDPAQITDTLRAAGHSLSRAWRDRARRERGRTPLDSFLGRHPLLLEVLDLARRVAASPRTSVLILGETGTGKGLLARAIHGESPRQSGPFVDINCAAIPENLIESELFGHVKGAFTGAVREKPGLLELADGGTAFLDEVGELSLPLQAKILKFLDEGLVRRVQGTTQARVDVRVIAATNRDLEAEVVHGRFRLDLLHRLNVVVLRLPPLRERPEDIPLLAQHFLRKLSLDLRGEVRAWAPEALKSLTAYAWPGNVRELQNVIERMVLLSAGREPIGLSDLPPGLLPQAPAAAVHVPLSVAEVELPPDGIPFEAIERAVLEAALKRTRGNVTRAAALLQMGRGGLRYRLDRLGLAGQASNRRGRPMKRRRAA
jgi:DNA-binding NtrC family response regulator